MRFRHPECCQENAVLFRWEVGDDNDEWAGVVRKAEGGRVQGRAVVSRFIGPGCGGCREAQMGRTLSRCVTETRTKAHTLHTCTLRRLCLR